MALDPDFQREMEAEWDALQDDLINDAYAEGDGGLQNDQVGGNAIKLNFKTPKVLTAKKKPLSKLNESVSQESPLVFGTPGGSKLASKEPEAGVAEPDMDEKLEEAPEEVMGDQLDISIRMESSRGLKRTRDESAGAKFKPRFGTGVKRRNFGQPMGTSGGSAATTGGGEMDEMVNMDPVWMGAAPLEEAQLPPPIPEKVLFPKLLLRPPEGLGGSRSITFPDNGGRFFVKQFSPDELFAEEVAEMENLNKESTFLEAPIEKMLSAIDKEIFEKIENFDNEMDEDDIADDVVVTKPWVDLHKPERFTDLLSSDEINRNVLTWVKAWDGIVHRKAKKLEKVKADKKKKSYISSMPKFDSEKDKNWKPKFMKKPAIEDRDDEELPKIILLCGPPGTGKTTLAHIVAKHCGYKVFEINASDDRSAKELTQKIEAACTMQACFGADKRPNLIVLDEIDGIDGASTVTTLLKIVQQGFRGANKGEKKPLRRPVICICNNQYAKSLRPLKRVGEVFVFKPIRSRHLQDKLKFIARKQGVLMEARAASYLAEITNCDIRSCVNTMQFIHSKCNMRKQGLSTRISMRILEKTPIGRKDLTRSLFEVLDLIFFEQKDSDKHEVDRAPADRLQGKLSKNVKLEVEICDMFRSLDGDRVLKSVTEHYLENSYMDQKFHKTAYAAEALQFADMFDSHIRTHQTYFLLAYLPYATIDVRRSIKQRNWRRLNYPKQDWEMYSAKKDSLSILDNFLTPDENSTGMGITRSASKSAIIQDYIPYLNSILRPPITPVDMRNLNPGSVKEWLFRKTVENFCEYNISVRFDNSVEPPIDRLVHYESPLAQGVLRVPCKELMRKLSHEISLENMRRNETRMSGETITPLTFGNRIQPENDDMQIGGGSMDISPSRRDALSELPMKTPKKNLAFGDGGSQESSNPNTPFQSQVFGGQRGAVVVEDVKYSQTPSQQRGIKHNFLKDGAVQKRTVGNYRYNIRFRFVVGHTNAVKRKSFVRDWCARSRSKK